MAGLKEIQDVLNDPRLKLTEAKMCSGSFISEQSVTSVIASLEREASE